MKVRKAVIPAAGFGTRFLPASKATPKEMVAVVDRPAIQYVVEEAASSGIEDVLIITAGGKDSIADHFDRAWELENLLSEKGKLDLLAAVRDVADLAQVHTVRQAEALGLGHAIGVAARHVGDEPFAVLLPDDLIGAGETLLADMIAAYGRHETSVVASMRVDGPEISLYGSAAVEPEPLEPGLFRMTDVIEKPDPDEAPSDLAVIGRYVFHPSIFESIRATKPDHRGEIQITDAIKHGIGGNGGLTLAFDGTRYDVGDKADYLRATVELAAGHPQLGERFRAFLREFATTLDDRDPQDR